jgi:hypothetical protein
MRKIDVKEMLAVCFIQTFYCPCLFNHFGLFFLEYCTSNVEVILFRYVTVLLQRTAEMLLEIKTTSTASCCVRGVRGAAQVVQSGSWNQDDEHGKLLCPHVGSADGDEGALQLEDQRMGKDVS